MYIKSFIAITVLAASIFACGGKKQDDQKNNTDPSALVDGTYKVDLEASKTTWNASKVTGKHNGTLKMTTAHFDVNQGNIVAGIFEFDMNSIAVLDIPAEDESNAKLVGHLKSPDFFDAANYPKSKFMIKEAQRNQDGTIQIVGDLEIKGHLEEISFPVSIKVENNVSKISGSVTFDRTKFDIKYNSKVLGTLPDKIIYDEVSLDLDLTANIQSMQ